MQCFKTFLALLYVFLELWTVEPKSKAQLHGCSDVNPKVCEGRKDKGYCTNPKVQAAMERICPKSCGVCSSGHCKDVDRYNNCKRLVAEGACLDPAKKMEMKHNCRKSCNFCQDPLECRDDDDDDNCDDTAERGSCMAQVNKWWWEKKCKRSCNFCNCADYDEKVCKEKANQGHCSDPETKDAMSRMCRTSCGVCGNVGNLCEDINPRICIERASKGACTDPETKNHMKHICKKTCDMCGSNEPNHCEDLDPVHCKSRIKDCAKLRTGVEMARKCPKTCKKCNLDCGGPGEKDLNPRVCALRAAQGYCDDPTVKKYMKEICPRSCFVCPELVIN